MQATTSVLPSTPRRVLRGVLRRGIALGLLALTDLRVEGRENLPSGGPLLVVGNHFSFLDPVVFIHTLPYSLEFVGGVQAPNAPPAVGWIRNLWGILHVRRGSSSRDALLRAQAILHRQGVLGIFPEGGSWARVLRPARPGAAFLAARSGARILPVGLDGLVDVFPSLRRGKRAHVTVRFGAPFGPYRFDARDRSSRQQVDEIGEQIMRRIAALLPPERRGYFSDDPAVRAAAKGTEVYPWDHRLEG